MSALSSLDVSRVLRSRPPAHPNLTVCDVPLMPSDAVQGRRGPVPCLFVTCSIAPIIGLKWSYCKFRRGYAYAPGSAAASEPAGLWGKRRPGSIHLPADARAKKQKRPASVQRRRPHNGADAYLRLRFASIRQAGGALRTLLPLTGCASESGGPRRIGQDD